MRTATSSTKVARILSTVVIALGAVFVATGALTYGAVAQNLKAEEITVAPDAAHFAGQLVDTPWEAFAQADIINHHALAATDGKTYAEIGADMHALEAKLTEQGLDADQVKADPQYAQLQGLRTTVMNGSFLRASLFTSVIAFGVGALVVGLGLVLAVIGYVLRVTTAGRPDVRPEGGEPATV